MKYLVILFALVLSGVASADFATDVTLNLRADENYTLTVDNAAEPLESWTMRLSGVGTKGWDTVNGGSAFVLSPDVRINNDDIHSDVMTFRLSAGALVGSVSVSGDIDGGISGVETVLVYQSGATRTITHTVSGVDPTFVWFATIRESVVPPPVGPIVDGVGEATLTWVAPTENEDGSTLADLSGFVVYWDGMSSRNRCGDYPVGKLDGFCYGNALDVPDSAATTVDIVLSIDQDSSVYFAVTAYRVTTDPTTGELVTVMSQFSNEIEKKFEIVVTDPPASPPNAPLMFSVTVTLTCTADVASATCEVIEVTP